MNAPLPAYRFRFGKTFLPPATRIRRHCLVGTAFLLVLSALGRPAHAGITLTVQQQGSDVVIEYSGSWENWARDTSFSTNDRAVFNVGLYNTSGAILDVMDGAVGQGGMSLDSGSWTNVLTYADSVTGDELAWSSIYTFAPEGYTAGDTLTGSLTFLNTDLTTMGFTDGDSGSWSGGAGTVTFTVSGGAAVPEPSSLALLGCGGIVASGVQRWRSKKKGASAA